MGADHSSTPFGAFLRDVRDQFADVAPPFRSDVVVDRSAWRRLFEPVTPIPGESLRGVVARSCRDNHLPNSFGLLRHLGLVHRNRIIVSEDQDINPTELAWAMRTGEPEVRTRRYDPLARGRISFFGLDVPARRIEIGRRRFSPTAFRMERGDQPHFHRAAWELRDIPFCFEGWDMLQDRCFCERDGVVQGWSRTVTRIEECDRCGDPLGWLEPFPVPERMRSELRLLEALVTPDAARRTAARELLPPPLRQADRSGLFRVVTRLADAIDPHASDHPVEDPERRLHALHAACTALRRWPEGLAGIRLPSGRSIEPGSAIWTAWNGLAPIPPALTVPLGPSTAISAAPSPDPPVGIRRGTEIARLSPEALTAAWNHGLVTRLQRRHGDRVLPAFDPAELPAFGKAWRERRGCASLGHELGIPSYGVEDMAATGRIAADGPVVPGEGPQFTPASVRAFVDALEKAAGPIADPVHLRQAMRLVGGRLKPWGAVFDQLLSGAIPFCLGDGRRLADRILIPSWRASAVATLHRLAAPDVTRSMEMVQTDALEVLNVTGDLAHLLDDLPATGRNPRNYRVADVERLAGTIVTIPEIAARLSTDPATAYQELRRRDLLGKAVRQGAWSRDLLTELA